MDKKAFLLSVIFFSVIQSQAESQMEQSIPVDSTQAKSQTPVKDKGYFLYKIREGETLYSIAKRNCISVEEIYKLNPGLKGGNYKVGDSINLYRPKGCKSINKDKVNKGYSVDKTDEKIKEEVKEEKSISPNNNVGSNVADRFNEISQRLAPYSKVFEINDNEGYKTVRISLKDINLIQCNDVITGYSFSKEKNLIVKQSDDRRFLYVKIAPISIEDPDKDKPIIKYEDYPREFYVECSSKVYSLVLVPEDIPSQIIRINSPIINNANKNPDFRSSSYENSILSLLREVYTTPLNQLPYDYKPLKEVEKYKEIDVVGVRVYFAGDYRVKEYVVISKNKGKMELHEALFLKYSKYPLAVMLTKPVLQEGESSVLYIVEKNAD